MAGTQTHHAQDIAGWREIIGNAFGALEIEARADRPFRGRFRYNVLSDLVLAEVSSANENARRTRRHIAGDSEEAYAFAFTRRGSIEVSQFGKSIVAPEGTFTLLDLNSPYLLAHAEETDLVTLKVPAVMLRARIPSPARHVLEVYSTERGIARVSRDLLLSLVAECASVPEVLAGAYAARVIDMFGMLVDASDANAEGGSIAAGTVLQRCKSLVEARLSDASLDPSAVAAAAGVSLRYAQKVFAETGETISDYIRRRRLDLCRRELCDPSRASASVKSIALNCGFVSQAHFSTLYRRAYGVTPRAARKANRN